MAKISHTLHRYLRLILLAVVTVLLVNLIVDKIEVFGKILLVVVGFGAVVLVHEFGHFILAKASDIKVEAFSIGFSPVLLGILKTEAGFRIRVLPGFLPVEGESDSDGSVVSFTIGGRGKAGETEYRIGLIPFGGFVKMLGQEDTKEVERSDNPRSYANKSVGPRASVIAAGVVFNVISAIMIFMIVFLVGIELSPAIIGGVTPGSPADKAGLVAGDVVIEIDGKTKDLDFTSIAMAAALSGRDEDVPIKVRHADGTEEVKVVYAEQLDEEPIRRFGVIQPFSLKIANVSDSNELKEATGLTPGDRIVSVNGRDIEHHWELMEEVQTSLRAEATVLAERRLGKDETELVESKLALELGLGVALDLENEADLSHIYSMIPRLRVMIALGPKVPAWDKFVKWIKGLFSAGAEPEAQAADWLMAGDIILEVADIKNPTYKDLRDAAEKYVDSELPIRVLRLNENGQQIELVVKTVPRRLPETKRAIIGIVPALDGDHPVVAKAISPAGGPERIDIPAGAIIKRIAGVEVASFFDVMGQMSKHQGEQIKIDYQIDGQAKTVTANVSAGENVVTVRREFKHFVPFEDLVQKYKATGPLNAIVMGQRRAVVFVAQAYLTLRRLAAGLVSPKSFMGPVGIAKLSYDIVDRMPLIYYLYFIGLINTFIAVFNSLPFLPFDGGHIVFLTLEKLKGSPVSEKIQGAVTYVGLVVVGMFALYVTFNDIVRSFFGG
jgi:regulator of sigma E protease